LFAGSRMEQFVPIAWTVWTERTRYRQWLDLRSVLHPTNQSFIMVIISSVLSRCHLLAVQTANCFLSVVLESSCWLSYWHLTDFVFTQQLAALFSMKWCCDHHLESETILPHFIPSPVSCCSHSCLEQFAWLCPIITFYCNLSPAAEDILDSAVISGTSSSDITNYVTVDFVMAIAILATLKIPIDWLIANARFARRLLLYVYYVSVIGV